jgi:hypothetical protein
MQSSMKKIKKVKQVLKIKIPEATAARTNNPVIAVFVRLVILWCFQLANLAPNQKPTTGEKEFSSGFLFTPINRSSFRFRSILSPASVTSPHRCFCSESEELNDADINVQGGRPSNPQNALCVNAGTLTSQGARKSPGFESRPTLQRQRPGLWRPGPSFTPNSCCS